MDELRKFFVPELVTGTGALALAGRYAVNLGCKRLLVVTNPRRLVHGALRILYAAAL